MLPTWVLVAAGKIVIVGFFEIYFLCFLRQEVLLQLERRARAQKLISATRHSLEQQKSNDEISLKSTTSADEVAALGDEARPGQYK